MFSSCVIEPTGSQFATNKLVFFINSLRHYKCLNFGVYFLLWGNGGPNFASEFHLWEIEEEQSWTPVGRKTFANVVRQPLLGENRIPLGRRSPVRAMPTRLEDNQLSFIQSFTS
jgi:hypothetical protein